MDSTTPTSATKVKQFNNKDWYWCVTCGCWTLSHSTNGFTHNGTTIAKHEGPAKNKCFSMFPPSMDQPSKKQKSAFTMINGLKSLKAEIAKQSQSSLIDLIKVAAQEK